MGETLAAGSGAEQRPLTEESPTGNYPCLLLSFHLFSPFPWLGGWLKGCSCPGGMAKAGVAWRGPRKPWLRHRRELKIRLSNCPWSGGGGLACSFGPNDF